MMRASKILKNAWRMLMRTGGKPCSLRAFAQGEVKRAEERGHYDYTSSAARTWLRRK